MSDKSENIGNNFTTDPKTGKSIFAKGNTIGRIKKKGFTLTDLNKLMGELDEEEKRSLLKHYHKRLYKNDKLLQNYIEKNVPTKTIQELTGKDGTPLNFIIRKTYEKGKNESSE